MSSIRRHSLAAGLLYLLTFASSIPAVFLLDPILRDPTYIVGPGADGRVIGGAFLDLVNALACIGTAVALYPIVRRESEALALGFVTSRMFEAATIVIGVVAVLAVVTLRQEGVAGTDAASLTAVGRALVAVRNETFLLGPSLMPGINALLLGTLLYRSRLVPRPIPVLALIGGPLLLSSAIGTLFGINDRLSVWSAIATVPIFAWELLLALRLTIVGFNGSAPILAGTSDAAAPTLEAPAGAA
jgi:Domain of unknown function (DUF4386)